MSRTSNVIAGIMIVLCFFTSCLIEGANAEKVQYIPATAFQPLVVRATVKAERCTVCIFTKLMIIIGTVKRSRPVTRRGRTMLAEAIVHVKSLVASVTRDPLPKMIDRSAILARK